jgi:hypothetical protein
MLIIVTPEKRMMKTLAFAAGAVLLTTSCVQPPNYPIEPQIAFVSMSDSEVVQFDTIVMRFSFTDGDGDIGYENPSAQDCNGCDSSCYSHPTINLFVRDTRQNCIIPYHTPYIEGVGKIDDISGDFYVTTVPLIVFTPPADTFTFQVQLKDRAGHYSNLAETSQVIVRTQ